MNVAATTFQFACITAVLGGLFGGLAARFDTWLWVLPWLVLSAASASLARRLMPSDVAPIDAVAFWGATLIVVTLVVLWVGPGFLLMTLWHQADALAALAALLATMVCSSIAVVRAARP